jgi:hypothetical protein
VQSVGDRLSSGSSETVTVVRADMQRRAASRGQSRQQGQSRGGNKASISKNGGLRRSAIKASNKEQ